MIVKYFLIVNKNSFKLFRKLYFVVLTAMIKPSEIIIYYFSKI